MSQSGNTVNSWSSKRAGHRRRAVGERVQARERAPAVNSGWPNNMPIIVGTITVVRHLVLLDERQHLRRDRTATGTPTRRPWRARRASRPSTRRGTSASGARTRRRRENRQRGITWYRLSISARWSSSTPLGRPVVPPVYISTTGSSSSGSSGISGVAPARRSSYVDVVRRVAVADHDDVLDADGGAHLVDDRREELVGEAHLGARSRRGCTRAPWARGAGSAG